MRKMSVFATFIVVLSLASVDGMPNIFQYELKKAENFVHEFEIPEGKPGEKESNPTLKAFSWSDCGNASSIVHIHSLSVAPDPLSFPGALVITANFSLTEDLSPKLSAYLTIEKKILGTYVKIPCIDGFGSCEYDDLCNDLVSIKGQCPAPVEKLIGNQCQCPIKQDNYVLPKSSIQVDAALIPSGDYKFEAVVTKNGKPAACLRLALSLI